MPPNDPKALAEKIKAVLSNDDERIAAGRAAYERSKLFSVDQLNVKFVELVEKMVQSGQALAP